MKNHPKIWFSISLILSLVLFCCLLPLATRAFGISPPHVINDKLSCGSHYEQRISLSRTNPQEEVNCEVKFDTPGFEDWFTVSPDRTFPFPKGEKVTRMFVKVDVPKDAEPGRYKGSIRVRVVPKELEKGKVSIVLGARITVDLTITSEEFADFKVRRVKIPDLEEEWTIEVEMKIENKGNVEIAPNKVTIDIYDSGHKSLLKSAETTKIAKIKPFETTEVSAFLNAGILAVGQYWGEVKIYKGEEVAWYEKAIFTVRPKGTLPPRAKAGTGLGLSGVWLWVVILVAVCCITGVGCWIWRRKKKKP